MLQRSSHLRNHSKAKYHGKQKTKNLRAGFALHLLLESRTGHTNLDWDVKIDSKTLLIGDLIHEHFDSIERTVKEFFDTILKEFYQKDLGPDRQSLALLSGASSARQLMENTLSRPLQDFAAMDPDTKLRIFAIATAILDNGDRVWMDTRFLRTLSTVAHALQLLDDKEASDFLLQSCAFLMQAGLAFCGPSTGKGGVESAAIQSEKVFFCLLASLFSFPCPLVFSWISSWP